MPDLLDLAKVPPISHKVPETPPVKHIEMNADDEGRRSPKPEITMKVGDGPEVPLQTIKRDEQGLETIRQYAVDLREDDDKVKAAGEVLESIEKNWPEFQEVERLEDELAQAKDKLRRRREGSTEYLAQTEAVATAKRKKKEDSEILSDYLVAHFRLTGERQVLMNDENGDAREVKITAKLGKEVKYQTSLDLAQEE